jgi:hypothetical protein
MYINNKNLPKIFAPIHGGKNLALVGKSIDDCF